jgi:caa(3)-type oxidase subunit IV
MSTAQDSIIQDPAARRELWRRMQIPVFAFVVLLMFLSAIVLLGALAPSRIASFIEIGLAVCMIVTVLLFSMEVRLEAPLMRFFSLLGFAWVCILFGMVLLDYLSR